ncbi:hypothetical protein HDU85_006297 [Gaertneriomyces sp. JEL0708]|nr:hypothetical protein HDU85_006297 [Gaertneriomyces sp. JEL0708]
MSISPLPNEPPAAAGNFEASIQQYLQALLDLGRAVYHVPEGNENETIVADKMDEVIQALGVLDEAKETVTTRLPLAVVEQIDEGNNPDGLLQEWVKALIDKNHRANGQMKAMQALQQDLHARLRASHPDLALALDPQADTTSDSMIVKPTVEEAKPQQGVSSTSMAEAVVPPPDLDLSEYNV